MQGGRVNSHFGSLGVSKRAVFCRVAAPTVKWVDGRLSVRFPLRRGADLLAVLAELAAQLGGGGGRAPENPGAPPGPDPGYPALEGEAVMDYVKACLEPYPRPCLCQMLCVKQGSAAMSNRHGPPHVLKASDLSSCAYIASRCRGMHDRALA